MIEGEMRYFSEKLRQFNEGTKIICINFTRLTKRLPNCL